jgi:hypothetical protein
LIEKERKKNKELQRKRKMEKMNLTKSIVGLQYGGHETLPVAY